MSAARGTVDSRFGGTFTLTLIVLMLGIALAWPGPTVAEEACWLAEKRTKVSRLLSCVCDDSTFSAKAKMGMLGLKPITGPMSEAACLRKKAANFQGYTDCYVGKKKVGKRIDYKIFCSDSVVGGVYKMQQAGYTRLAGPMTDAKAKAEVAKYKAGGGGGGAGGGGTGTGGGGTGTVKPPKGGGYWQMIKIVGKPRPLGTHKCYPEKAGGGEGAATFSFRTVCIKPPGRYGGVARWKRPPTVIKPEVPFPITLTVSRTANDKRFSLGLKMSAGVEPVDIPCGYTKGGQKMYVQVGSKRGPATATKTEQFTLPDGGPETRKLALLYCADKWSQQYIYQWIPKGKKGLKVTLPPFPGGGGRGGQDTGGGSGQNQDEGGGTLSSCAPFSQIPGYESQEKLIWSLKNKGGVVNGPKQPTLMVLRKKHLVTRISTYHWNNGKGDLDESKVPRSISLGDKKGNRYGPWFPLAQNPDKTNPKLYWMVRPNIVLPPGTYRILDSHWKTLANNGGTGYRGMARAWGVPCD